MEARLFLCLIVFLWLVANVDIQAATYTSVAPGGWTTASTWSPAVTGGPSIDDIVIINHTITRAATSLTGWTSSASITINSGGALNFNGNVDWTGTGVNIYVKTGGTLSVTGTLTLNNQSEIIMQGGTVDTSGAFSVDGGTYSSTFGSSTRVASLTTTSSGTTSFSTAGTLTVTGTGTVTAGGAITNTGIMNIGGDLVGGGGSSAIITNSGTMNISGSVVLPSSSKFYTNPGAVTKVTQNVTTLANENLIIGTNANPLPYADFVIKGNLIAQGSGDILIDTNGRLAVFGNFSSNGGGGSTFTVNDGGQVYVNGTIVFNGGGDHLTNNNDGTPYYGFYSPNQPVYNGGGGDSNGTASSNTVQNVTTLQNQNIDFFLWVTSLSGSPLPITLVYFKASKISSGYVELNWATATELNFDKFAIERSVDGVTFTTLGEQAGAGHNIEKLAEYAFTDNNPLIGKIYYRLKSIDLDGKYDYSNVVKMNYEADKSFAVYPNPSSGNSINISANFEIGSGDFIQIFDNAGIKKYEARLSTAENQIEFSNSLNSGVYLLKFVSGEYVKITRLLIDKN